MTAAGWLLMVVSLTFVGTLAGWCYYKVLTVKDKEEPPKPVKDFHSA